MKLLWTYHCFSNRDGVVDLKSADLFTSINKFIHKPAWCETKSSALLVTCFEGEFVLFLAIIVIEGPHTDPSPSAGVILEGVAIPTVFIAGVGSRLLVVGPLSRVRLVLVIAAHAEGATKCKRVSQCDCHSLFVWGCDFTDDTIPWTNLLRSPGGATWSVLGVGGAPSGFFFFGGAVACSGLYS